ncbi:uncharacterized protein [Halyomorpha halys]|uniref:uncharacterized protein n=1 Tax=Halyomorpha halys TaxID=286706 RepID=UPI000D0C8BB6|nr:uncharacterized protein LOC106684101 [Halyomorpha halys]
MRYLVLCVLLSYGYAASVEDPAEDIIMKEMEVKQKCMDNANVDEKEVKAILNQGELPAEQKIKCLFGCFMKGMGYLSDNGTIDWNIVDDINRKQNVSPEDLKKALEVSAVCRQLVPQNLGNLCDAGYAARKCFADEAKKRMNPKTVKQ